MALRIRSPLKNHAPAAKIPIDNVGIVWYNSYS